MYNLTLDYFIYCTCYTTTSRFCARKKSSVLCKFYFIQNGLMFRQSKSSVLTGSFKVLTEWLEFFNGCDLGRFIHIISQHHLFQRTVSRIVEVMPNDFLLARIESGFSINGGLFVENSKRILNGKHEEEDQKAKERKKAENSVQNEILNMYRVIAQLETLRE